MKQSFAYILCCGLLIFSLSISAQRVIDNSLSIQEFPGKQLPLDWKSKFLTEKHSIKTLGVNIDKVGNQHERHQLFYEGIPLKGLNITSHQLKDVVNVVSPIQIPGAEKLQVTKASFTPDEARAMAKKHVPAKMYGLHGHGGEDFVPPVLLSYVPANLDWEKNDWRLTYEVDIYCEDPHQVKRVYLDATDGSLIFIENRLCSYHVEGTAETFYHGTQTIETTLEGDKYILWDQTRGGGLRTLNLNSDNGDFFDSDNFWDNVNEDMDEIATDVHWGSAQTWDMYQEKFNRLGVDGNGGALNSIVHLDDANAFWNGFETRYGDGGGSLPNPFTYIDIIAHEMSHGVTQFTSNLVYIRQPGGLNEAFSDIMGMSGENYAIPGAVNWIVGEQLSNSGGNIRNMKDPKSKSLPSTMGGEFWSPDLGVHSMSSLANLWYYLLVEGDSGVNDLGYEYNVPGLGWDDAEQIAYSTFTNYLNPNSSYVQCAELSLIAASDLFGNCSDQLNAALEAWRAVGVLDPASEISMNATRKKVCELDVEITFRLNMAVEDVLWEFGDGNTSTELQPTHVYISNGEYTFSATGNSCENGPFNVQSSYQIQVDENLEDCDEIIQEADTEFTTYYCEGTVIDDGGLNEEYSNNQSTSLLVEAPNAVAYEVEIVSFLTDDDPMQIRVDNGGFFSNRITLNNNEAPRFLFYEANRIDFVFYADGSGTADGYEIRWKCFEELEEPTVDPIGNELDCPNDILFTSNSKNASRVEWDFGDGEEDSGLSVSHKYSQAGTYTVTVTAINSDFTITETFEQVVDYPEAEIMGATQILPNVSTEYSTEFTGNVNVNSVIWRLDGNVEGVGFTTDIEIADLGTHELSVIAQYGNGCGDKDTFFIEVVDELSNLETISDANLQIFPNPASKTINIINDGALEGNWKISLLNKLGQTAHLFESEFQGSKNQSYELPALPTGMYYLEFYQPDGERRLLKKLVITK